MYYFLDISGSVLMSLHKHTSILRSFPILVYSGESQGSWDSDVLHWHTAFTQQMVCIWPQQLFSLYQFLVQVCVGTCIYNFNHLFIYKR